MVDAIVQTQSPAVRSEKTDKFAVRRRELAEAALKAVSERGFANTGLRDIAAHTALSLGVLHYYFTDKNDLIGQAIWQAKEQCVRRYDLIVATAVTGDELAERFGAEIAKTMVEDAGEHRLWYDLRNQALFQAGFLDIIIAIDSLLSGMVWKVVLRYAQLEHRTPTIDAASAYALFDGIFRNSLIAHLRGERDAAEKLRLATIRLLHGAI